MTMFATPLRREIVLALALTALGGVIRLWSVQRLGIEHYDEGVYAFAGLWAQSPHGVLAIEPKVLFFAPPAFPLLVGVAYLLLGVSDLSAIAVSLVCGILTVPMMAWLGRRTFGPGGGATTAAFAALAAPHIAFSRMALTDAMFLLSWALAIGLGCRFLERPGLGRALVFGAAAGLAQNVKYNGWLAGAIVGLVPLIDLLVARERRRLALRTIGFGIVAAIVAALVYAPWFWFVDKHVTYSRLLEHHQSYAGGIGRWWPYLNGQLAQAVALSGGPIWGAAGWGLAWTARAIVVGRHAVSGPREYGFFAIGLIAGAGLVAALPTLPWWIGLVCFPWLIQDRRPAWRVLALWWLVMTVLTPCYHPYARLWLPLHAAGWLMMAGVVDRAQQVFGANVAAADRQTSGMRRSWLPIAASLVPIGLATFQCFGSSPRPRPLPDLLGPSDSLGQAAHQIAEAERVRGGHDTFLMLTRPCFSFYAVAVEHLEGRPFTFFNDWLVAPQRSSTTQLLGVLDEGQFNLGELNDRLREAESRWSLILEVRDAINGPTLLDIDPGAALGRTTVGQPPGQVAEWDGLGGWGPRGRPALRFLVFKPRALRGQTP